VASCGRRARKYFCDFFPGLLLLMLQKKIERFCIEWIEMTLCLLRCSLFGFCQLHFMTVIIDALVFIWKLNLLRLIPHDQISLFRTPPHICIEFLELSSGFLGYFCPWFFPGISPVDFDALWLWSCWYSLLSLVEILNGRQYSVRVTYSRTLIFYFHLLGAYFMETTGLFDPPPQALLHSAMVPSPTLHFFP
jgi:hypothetical protein